TTPTTSRRPATQSTTARASSTFTRRGELATKLSPSMSAPAATTISASSKVVIPQIFTIMLEPPAPGPSAHLARRWRGRCPLPVRRSALPQLIPLPEGARHEPGYATQLLQVLCPHQQHGGSKLSFDLVEIGQ